MVKFYAGLSASPSLNKHARVERQRNEQYVDLTGALSLYLLYAIWMIPTRLPPSGLVAKRLPPFTNTHVSQPIMFKNDRRLPNHNLLALLSILNRLIRLAVGCCLLCVQQ